MFVVHFLEDFLVVQFVMTWIWIMFNLSLFTYCIVSWTNLHIARWMVTNGNAIFATSLIHEYSFCPWCYPSCKSTLFITHLWNAFIYVVQYTFQCICSYIQVMHLIQVLVVDRNILDTKDLDFASRRDMDMAIALLVGSSFTFDYNNA